MRRTFILGIVLLIVYEILKVYFIMPMPGSQKMNSLEPAYFLHSWRWGFRLLYITLILAGIRPSFIRRPWLSGMLMLLGMGIFALFNFKMNADTMFYQPQTLKHADSKDNKVDPERLVLGISINGQSKAWPLQYIAYHHQVRDTVGGESVMVTYCSVCRTGRVFSPVIKGKNETFRLVGMDHFNAMFEDQSTGSWWRQVNGICVAGPLKGEQLKEMLCSQVALKDWLEMHPESLVMQPDPKFAHEYADLKGYDEGTMKSSLEGTDTGSWKEKSWVLGTVVGNQAICWDWNKLKRKGSSSMVLDGHRITATILPGGSRFYVERHCKNEGTDEPMKFMDTCTQSLPAYQEFWHSWRTFHPQTMKGN